MASTSTEKFRPDCHAGQDTQDARQWSVSHPKAQPRESRPQVKADFVKDTHTEKLAPGATESTEPGHRMGPTAHSAGSEGNTIKLVHL